MEHCRANDGATDGAEDVDAVIRSSFMHECENCRVRRVTSGCIRPECMGRSLDDVIDIGAVEAEHVQGRKHLKVDKVPRLEASMVHIPDAEKYNRERL